MRPSFSDDELRAALRAEAASHRPDRDAMLARITSTAMTTPAPARRSPKLRLAFVGALVALFGGGGFAAQWALAGATDDDQAVPVPVVSAATTAAPRPSVTATTRAVPPPVATTTKKKPTTTKPTPAKTTMNPAPAKGQPGFTRVEQGPLWSDGSIAPDSGDTRGAGVITLKSSEKLTALTVTVRVAKTAGLTSRGGTKSVPGASVSTAVAEESDALLYTFTLASADEVAPGTYTFTAKYAYPAGGRNAGGDTYEAVATTASGQDLDVYGNFYPAG